MNTTELTEKLIERLPELKKFNPKFLESVLAVAIGDDEFVTQQKHNEVVRMHKGLAEAQVKQANQHADTVKAEMTNTKAEWRMRIIEGVRPMIGGLKSKYRQEGAQWALRAFERVGAQQDQWSDFSSSEYRKEKGQ